MDKLTGKIRTLCPGLSTRGRPGTGLALAVAFYALAALVLIRAGRFLDLGVAARWPMIVALATLYAGSVYAPLAGREGQRFGRRFTGNRLSFIGLILILALACAAVAAPLLSAADPLAINNPAIERYLGPSFAHPMGTDKFGRDVWARILYGGRVSLGIGVMAVLLSSLLGTLYGGIAGYAGGRTDDVMMRVVDGLLSFPRLLFVLTLVALFTNSVPLLIGAIAAVSWMSVARVVRGEVVRIKQRAFVEAAVASGAGRVRVMSSHLLPAAIGAVIVASTLNVGTVILLESYLSFLGLGLQPPSPSWGAMVHDGRDALIQAWWVSAFPAGAITLAVVGFNLVGDGLRDALDTRIHAGEAPGRHE